MMRTGKFLARALLVTVMALPLLGLTATAEAYDAENTHRWVAREAVKLLVATYPGEYDELLEYENEVAEGALHEDDLFLDGDTDPSTLRVMRHFYNATDRAGLTFGGQTFPNAYEWNSEDTEENDWDYTDGMRAYQKGELSEAYFIAGHTVHLITDLTVPAHSHNDDHGPPDGDDYEDHCASRMISQYEGSLKAPPEGSFVPEFLDLADAFQKTADASYYRNLYPGYLGDESVDGIISKMFPEMYRGVFSDAWEIDGVGSEGVGFYAERPGYYYFSKNDVASKYDIVNYDYRDPFDAKYGPIESDAPMVERMADDLLPVAILHSAAVLKLFIDDARKLPKLNDKDEAPSDDGGCNAAGSSKTPWSALMILLGMCLAFVRRNQTEPTTLTRETPCSKTL